jgi:hypothetical protein
LVLLPLAALVVGCGKAARAGDPTGVAGAGSDGGAAAAGASSDGPTGAVDISGRWGLFVLLDLVGVQLTQVGQTLSGRGCASGAPPLAEAEAYGRCGTIAGNVDGNRTSFGFELENGSGSYYAETIVSADGQRMTGRFRGLTEVPYPTAWLRVADDQPWLEFGIGRHSVRNGSYDLRLESASEGGSEYDAAKSYGLTYLDGEGLFSDLGSFWHEEIVPAGPYGALVVGPVPVTAPELAVSLRLEISGEAFDRVHATTGSGHEYTFTASPSTAP